MSINKSRVVLIISAVLIPLLLTACSGSSSSDSSDVYSDTLDYFTDSVNVSSVKDASLSSCPTATLGEMADAFMSNANWTDFPSSTGSTIVELTGEISYDGYPADAIIQFELYGDSFEAVYLGINDVDQSKIVLSALLGKMCDATY